MGSKLTQVFQMVLALAFSAILLLVMRYVKTLDVKVSSGLRNEDSVLALAEVGEDASITMSGDSVIYVVITAASIDANRAFMQKPLIYENYKFKLGSLDLTAENVSEQIKPDRMYSGTVDLSTYLIVFREV